MYVCMCVWGGGGGGISLSVNTRRVAFFLASCPGSSQFFNVTRRKWDSLGIQFHMTDNHSTKTWEV